MSLPTGRVRPVTKEILNELARQWKRDISHLQVPVSRSLALKSGNNGIYCLKTSFVPGPETTDEAAARAFPEGNPPGVRSKKPCSQVTQRVILDVTTLAASEFEYSWRWEDRSFKLSARRYGKPSGLAFPGSGEGRAIFDADLFSCTLMIRTRQDGDCFSPFGVHSRSRKLKVFFNEKKVPIGMRDTLPIILSDKTLAWVPGYGISDFLKVKESTSSILELVLTCENL
jgi:tRNA(Ile)-lysidine synthetase-like protein